MHLEDVSDDEVAAPNHNLEPEEDQDKESLLRVFFRENSKPIVEVVPYDGKLDTNIVLDWIFDMEKFFEYENTLDNRKMKIAVTRMKGHASLWWEHLQTDRQRRGKEKIRTWPKMVNKVKKKFLTLNLNTLYILSKIAYRSFRTLHKRRADPTMVWTHPKKRS